MIHKFTYFSGRFIGLLVLSLLPLLLSPSVNCQLTATNDLLNYEDSEIFDTINGVYWQSRLREGIKVEYKQGYADRVIFEIPVSFKSTHFHAPVDFNFVSFNSSVNFDEATFDSPIICFSTEFGDNVTATRATFRSATTFNWVQFKGNMKFTGSAFDSVAQFNGVLFDPKSQVDFSNSRFQSGASFGNAKFGAFTSFHECEIQKGISFFGTKMPDSLDFRNVMLDEPVDFFYTLLPDSSRKTKIALFGTDLSMIAINFEAYCLWFPSDTLRFPVSTTGKKEAVMIPSAAERVSFYEQLLAKLRNDALPGSYEIVDKEYRWFTQDSLGDWGDEIKYHANLWWWDFGYDKKRIFLWSMAFWMTFTTGNLFAYKILRNEVYQIEFLDKQDGYVSKKWKRYLNHSRKVATYTAFIFFGLKMDPEKFKNGAVRNRPWFFAYLMLTYVIGLVCLGFIVNLIFS